MNELSLQLEAVNTMFFPTCVHAGPEFVAIGTRKGKCIVFSRATQRIHSIFTAKKVFGPVEFIAVCDYAIFFVVDRRIVGFSLADGLSLFDICLDTVADASPIRAWHQTGHHVVAATDGSILHITREGPALLSATEAVVVGFTHRDEPVKSTDSFTPELSPHQAWPIVDGLVGRSGATVMVVEGTGRRIVTGRMVVNEPILTVYRDPGGRIFVRTRSKRYCLTSQAVEDAPTAIVACYCGSELTVTPSQISIGSHIFSNLPDLWGLPGQSPALAVGPHFDIVTAYVSDGAAIITGATGGTTISLEGAALVAMHISDDNLIVAVASDSIVTLNLIAPDWRITELSSISLPSLPDRLALSEDATVGMTALCYETKGILSIVLVSFGNPSPVFQVFTGPIASTVFGAPGLVVQQGSATDLFTGTRSPFTAMKQTQATSTASPMTMAGHVLRLEIHAMALHMAMKNQGLASILTEALTGVGPSTLGVRIPSEHGALTLSPDATSRCAVYGTGPSAAVTMIEYTARALGCWGSRETRPSRTALLLAQAMARAHKLPALPGNSRTNPLGTAGAKMLSATPVDATVVSTLSEQLPNQVDSRHTAFTCNEPMLQQDGTLGHVSCDLRGVLMFLGHAAMVCPDIQLSPRAARLLLAHVMAWTAEEGFGGRGPTATPEGEGRGSEAMLSSVAMLFLKFIGESYEDCAEAFSHEDTTALVDTLLRAVIDPASTGNIEEKSVQFNAHARIILPMIAAVTPAPFVDHLTVLAALAAKSSHVRIPAAFVLKSTLVLEALATVPSSSPLPAFECISAVMTLQASKLHQSLNKSIRRTVKAALNQPTVTLSADGRRVAAADCTLAAVWRVTTGKRSHVVPIPGLPDMLELAPDGSALAVRWGALSAVWKLMSRGRVEQAWMGTGAPVWSGAEFVQQV
ncbi:hypothetical protein J8273_8822 [Carpediemonas membranifera]|uniref:Uncharacterized protein n=1 Tax=Carpediemonas membranifera TaxID=201153 RepID=A0A8J6DX79_9EUKA|nr:hypothetical protein J8273_8822 [Carpediemonas membranifera]|eukprot:KAG9389529.1 hypothetical protein J8273_8822 [Carpediemonas membranifera]